MKKNKGSCNDKTTFDSKKASQQVPKSDRSRNPKTKPIPGTYGMGGRIKK